METITTASNEYLLHLEKFSEGCKKNGRVSTSDLQKCLSKVRNISYKSPGGLSATDYDQLNKRLIEVEKILLFKRSKKAAYKFKFIDSIRMLCCMNRLNPASSVDPKHDEVKSTNQISSIPLETIGEDPTHHPLDYAAASSRESAIPATGNPPSEMII